MAVVFACLELLFNPFVLIGPLLPMENLRRVIRWTSSTCPRSLKGILQSASIHNTSGTKSVGFPYQTILQFSIDINWVSYDLTEFSH